MPAQVLVDDDAVDQDLALGEDRVDDAADVIDGHDVADMDLAGVEVDIDARDARCPAERRVGIAGVGLVIERLARDLDPRRLIAGSFARTSSTSLGRRDWTGSPVAS